MGLPPTTSGRPGRSQPWRIPRALPPDVQGAWAGVSSAQQGRQSTWSLIGDSSRNKSSSSNHITLTIMCSGFQRRKLRLREAVNTRPGHTADLAPWGRGAHCGSAQLAAGWLEPSHQQCRQTTCLPRHLLGRRDPGLDPNTLPAPELTNPQATHTHQETT